MRRPTCLPRADAPRQNRLPRFRNILSASKSLHIGSGISYFWNIDHEICPESSKIFDQSLHNQLVRSEAPEYMARGGERSFPLSSPIDAQSVTRICAAITQHSRNGERLFVGPRDLRQTNYNDVYFYYLLPQLAPSTYFIEMNPFSANRADSRLGSDIGHADWLIPDSQLNEFREPNVSLQLGPDAPNVVVRDQFVQVAQLNQFSIFHRRRDL